MAEGIDDVVLRQNAVGGNKIFFDLVESQHVFLPGALPASYHV
jgi:hypothetical protein